MRKRSKRERQKKIELEPAEEEFKQSSPWKIVMMLLFLAVLAVLLLQDDDPDTSSGKKSRKIPNPESALPPSPSVLHTFKHAAVSTDSHFCSDIARNMLKKSGNVFDGTLAAMLCNSLTQVQSMGLLGGFLLTAYIKAERKAIIVDAQMTSPKNFRLPVKNVTDVKHGKLSIAVPGFLKGLWEIHRKYGTISWSELIEPTLSLCNEGITISKHLHDSMHMNKRILNDQYLRKLLVDPNTQKFKRPGSKINIDRHCDFLKLLANHSGPEIFSGEVGEILSKDLETAKSVITINDLKDYKVKWSEAIEFPINDDDKLLLPNTAAVLIPSILNILHQFKFNSSSFDAEGNANETILTHHRIVEAFKHVFAVRSRLGDPDFVDVRKTVNDLLSPQYAQRVGRLIDDTKTYGEAEKYSAEFIAPDDDGTSHVSIVTSNGDAISVTSSINYYFGAGISGTKTGLIFNNGMDDFSYPERAVNYFGLSETPTNYPEPGKRALSSMSPLIVVDRKSGKVKLVIGAAGGSKILSTLALALVRYACCTKNIKEIVDAPRFHHQLVPNEIEYEYGLVDAIVEGLAGKGHKMRRFKNRGTIVNALSRSGKDIHGIADYRKDWSGVAGY